MAKVLFSNPPWWVEPRGQEWIAGVRAGSRWPFTMMTRSRPDHVSLGEYVPYPFFLGFAASYARAAGHEVLFRDSIALRESYISWTKYLFRETPEYLVIESATPSWDHDRILLESLKGEFHSSLKIVLTGPIVAAQGQQALSAGLVRAAVKGEYEKGVLAVLNGESGFIERSLLTVDEMNRAPWPWMDALHSHLYFDSNPQGQQWPHLQAWTSRGCWAKCLFCLWPASMTGNDPDGTGRRSVRHYSPDYLEAYLSVMVERYHYRSIYFDDDLFNTSDKHVLAVCPVMRKIGLPWSAMCRADTIEPDTWGEMKKSGCFGVKIGIESGSQRVLDEIVNKRLDLGEALETLRLLKRLGMSVHTTWTVGLPGETDEERLQTISLIQRLYAEKLTDTHQLSGTACIEGSPLATLMARGQLPKYGGASTEGFDADPDGVRKMKRIALEMAKGK